jgi:hypothetical protein
MEKSGSASRTRSIPSRLLLLGALATLAVPFEITGQKAVAASLPGWSQTCYANNWQTGQLQPVPEINVVDPNLPWGHTDAQPNGTWLIRFNLQKIASPLATPAVLMFLFYHECSHARFATSDEGVADCQGLIAMRNDMTVTPQMYAEIAQVYASVGRPFPSGPCH